VAGLTRRRRAVTRWVKRFAGPVARKLARRSFHVLRELGPDALEPVAAA
jgi:hypothetical protein